MTVEVPSMSTRQPLLVLGMCNPLLDISANVDESLLERYGLKANDAILAEGVHLPLYKELAARPDVQFVPGGAGLNAVRVAQWLLRHSGSGDFATAYFGCIGHDDEFGRLLEEGCLRDGVLARFMRDKEGGSPTGTCAVCVSDNGRARSLVANLGAANNYKAAHAELHRAEFERARVIMATGFFITVSPETIELAARVAAARPEARFCMNISAPFIAQVPTFRETLMKMLPLVDLLFGNETEAQALAEALEWDSPQDIPAVAQRIANLPKDQLCSGNGKPGRWVVITQGCDPTVVAISGEPKPRLVPIVPLPQEKIVDANGAGDAYAGGFLAALALGMPVEECCRLGAFAASVIIQCNGCKLPDQPRPEQVKELAQLLTRHPSSLLQTIRA